MVWRVCGRVETCAGRWVYVEASTRLGQGDELSVFKALFAGYFELIPLSKGYNGI